MQAIQATPATQQAANNVLHPTISNAWKAAFTCTVNGLSYRTDAGRSGLRRSARKPRLHAILPAGYVDAELLRDFVDGYAVRGKPFQVDDLARTLKAALVRYLNAVAMSRPS
jgi:hypothetical protein